ncbi:lysylphosphatidylglycerol synthase transmembrane domain-containing protein [Halomarina litorea]|uniref:lysylphosphatidylglycerol synthase transmembrane domain-containing protein n=1 Tax=Halomarina litorea TaxID=2961595 RepID=UPI0020C30F1B|nr:flippase-like domain-containing protein [Halomarina sp. BCD28]
MDLNVRATAIGFLAALAALAVLLWVIGIDTIVRTMGMADPAILALLPFVGAAWLVSWGLSLRVVLGVIGTPISVTKSVLIYSAATFANNVTPFGQAGGEPITAYLIADATDNQYESGLAAIASVDALNFFPSLSLAGVALAYFGATATLGRQLRVAGVAIAVLALVVPLAGYALWRFRLHVEGGLARVLTPIARGLARPIPGRSAPDEAAVRVRIEGFFNAVGRVAEDRRRLVLALGFATIGWLALSTSLWLSLYSLGFRVPFAAALLVIPIGSLASITPFPGGLGGIEGVLIALLVPTTGVDLAAASAAVLIHRTVTYWLPTLFGGGVAAMYGFDAL